jgi:hypothetical protein
MSAPLEPCEPDELNTRPHEPRPHSAPDTERRTSARLPDAIRRKFDALPPEVRVLFTTVLPEIPNALAYCKERVLDLRVTYGWTLDEIITLAEKEDYQFGILRTQTRAAFEWLWKDHDENVAEAARKREAAAEAKRQSGKLRIRSVDELLALPPRDYLVKGWLSPDEMSLLVGAKNARKSFTALHVGYGVAQHWQKIFGRRVRGAPVLYLIAEGEKGVGKRLAALVTRHGRCADFHVIAQPVDLLRTTAEEGDLADIIKLAIANGVRLIIVDTINRALAGGDENSSIDMGVLSNNLNALRHATGAHVMGIHHGTWNDGTKSRGHSSLPAAVDAIAQLEWKDGIGTLALGFARDDISGALGAFRTEVVDLGKDTDGDEVTSLLINECDPAEAPAQPERKGRHKDREITDTQAQFLDVARNVIAGSGDLLVPMPMMPKVRAVSRAILRAELIAAGCFPEPMLESSFPDRKANDTPKLARSGYSMEHNALRGLKRQRLLMFSQEWVWLP